MLNIARLEARVRAAMAEAHVPGLALSIVANGELHYAAGFGVASVEDGGPPITPDTIFRIGSTSKPIAALVILRLVDEGRLELDTPIREILPDFALSEAGAVDRITLRMLLNHRSGLPSAANYLGAREPGEFRRLVYETLPEFPLLSPPGQRWSYSNPGIDLAALVAETATGEHYADLARRLVFEPLGLTRTTHDPLVAAAYPLAQSHHLDEAGELRVLRRVSDNVLHYASGFAFSTALDMAKFGQFFLQGGCWQGERLLSERSLAAMQGPETAFQGLFASSYGLGLIAYEHQGEWRYMHPGRIDGYAHIWSYIPARGAAVTIQCNQSAQWATHEERLTREIYTELLSLPAERQQFPAVAIAPQRYRALAGTYAANPLGLLELREDDGALLASFQGGEHRLQAASETLFYAEIAGEPEPLQILAEANDAGEYEEVSLLTHYAMPQRFQRLRIAPQEALAAARWSVYAGRYRNDRDVLQVTVAEADGQPLLQLQHPALGHQALPARPIGQHRFLCPAGLFRFELADDGRCLAVVAGVSLRFTREA